MRAPFSPLASAEMQRLFSGSTGQGLAANVVDPGGMRMSCLPVTFAQVE